jgi:ArsR family transcriptional regulator, virulence genes transcriptional regulator
MGALKNKTKSTEVASPGGTKKVARQVKTTKRASSCLKMLSDPTRIDILLTLADRKRGIGALSTALGQSQSAVSQHLALLRHDKLIHPQREGNQSIYSLTEYGGRIASCLDKLISPTIDSSLLQDVGGFVDDPEKWFRTSNVEFEGRRPVDLLGTSDEARLRNRIEAAKLGLFS